MPATGHAGSPSGTNSRPTSPAPSGTSRPWPLVGSASESVRSSAEGAEVVGGGVLASELSSACPGVLECPDVGDVAVGEVEDLDLVDVHGASGGGEAVPVGELRARAAEPGDDGVASVDDMVHELPDESGDVGRRNRTAIGAPSDGRGHGVIPAAVSCSRDSAGGFSSGAATNAGVSVGAAQALARRRRRVTTSTAASTPTTRAAEPATR